MKVKICGICRPADAEAAAAAGADYIGVILAPGSRRTQTAEAAAVIFAAAPACRRVGVFADQPLEEVNALAQALALDVVQLHGGEKPGFIAALSERSGRIVWKTVWPRTASGLKRAITRYTDRVGGLLLDGGRAGSRGGKGTAFDWSLAAAARALLPAGVELIVAGGLTPDNLGHAIAATRPDVVDVSSGVEAAPCRKSPAALQAFVRNAKS